MKSVFKKSLVFVLLLSLSAGATFRDSVTAVVVDAGDDAVAAFNRVKLLAKAGNAEAKAQLAELYLEGKGVARSVSKYLKYNKEAARLNVLKAQLALADAYYYGKDVTQSYKTSLKWYKLAAQQGCVEAQHRVGEMYRDGLGVAKKNTNKALGWFQKAADKGHELATRAVDAIKKAVS